MKGKQSVEHSKNKNKKNPLTEAHPIGDLTTQLEFTEALSGLSKDTTDGPDKVKYSDTKNLSDENESKLLTLYEESFPKGDVPKDWPYS